LPQPESASEGIVVVAGARTGGQRIELFDVASADDRIVGFERGNEACHDIGNVAAPLLLAVLLQPAPAHVVFEDAFLVGQLAELHGLDDTVDDHGRSKSGSEPEKEHLAALVAAERLHSCVIDEPHRAAQCGREIEPNPTASEIVWFGDRAAVDDRAGIADRY